MSGRSILSAAAARGRKGERKQVVTVDKLQQAREHIDSGLKVREAAARLNSAKPPFTPPYEEGSRFARLRTYPALRHIVNWVTISPISHPKGGIMWSKTYSKKVTDVQAENVWRVWTDINQWHMWQPDIEYAKLDGDFKVGNTFKLKPKSGPTVSIELINVEPGRQFTDLTRFPGARMYGSHEFIPHGDELEIRTTMSIEGFLSFLWKKVVAEGVANGMENQTEALIERARKL